MQWLDAVHQIAWQFPHEFEFNEHLLIDIRQLLPPPNTASARAFYEKVIDLLMDLSRCVWTSEVDPCCSPLYDRAAAVRRGLRLLPLRERVEQE